MNGKDRQRLSRLHQLMDQIPSPHLGDSTKTASTLGAVQFAVDMRGGMSAFRSTLYGMLLEGNEDVEEGWDYHDPDFVMDTFEAWIEIRKQQQWEDAGRNAFDIFFGKRRKERDGLTAVPN